MLLRPHDGGVIAIGQPAHAWLSAQIAAGWGNERFGAVVPQDEVCLATAQHDIGMAAWDVAPTLDPASGLPWSFLEMPLEIHLDLWLHAPERLLAQSRYAALLVSMHGSALYGRRVRDGLDADRLPAVQAYLTSQETLQRKLIASLGADPLTAPLVDETLIARNQRLIWTWDYLSLALCLDWAPSAITRVPTTTAPVPIEIRHPAGARWEGHGHSESSGLGHAALRFELDPWPLTHDELTVRCEGRLLTDTFDDEELMRAALGDADWVTLAFTLCRPE